MQETVHRQSSIHLNLVFWGRGLAVCLYVEGVDEEFLVFFRCAAVAAAADGPKFQFVTCHKRRSLAHDRWQPSIPPLGPNHSETKNKNRKMEQEGNKKLGNNEMSVSIFPIEMYEVPAHVPCFKCSVFH